MDIDIDFADPDAVKKLFKLTEASNVEQGKLIKHEVGVYFQDIAKDKVTGYAAVPYDKAESLGYLKIDFLHVRLLENFSSKEEIRKLLKIEPDWSILENEDQVNKLFHLKKHFDVVNKVKPRSIQEVADVLALIRPGKIKLLDKYLKDKEGTRAELYRKVDHSTLRRAHATPYAMLVILNMHLLSREKT